MLFDERLKERLKTAMLLGKVAAIGLSFRSKANNGTGRRKGRSATGSGIRSPARKSHYSSLLVGIEPFPGVRRKA